MKIVENSNNIAIADYTVAGAGMTTMSRERDIESIEMIMSMGAITIINAATEVADPALGLTSITITYDDKIIRIPGRMLAALQSFFYPDDPAYCSQVSFTDAATVAHPFCERFRIPCHIPARAGANVNIALIWGGEVMYSETVANTAVAASVIFFVPRYGTFSGALSMNFTYNPAVAVATPVLPAVTGDLVIGSIVGAYASSVAYTVDGTAGATNTYGAQSYETDAVTTLEVRVAGETVIALPFGIQSQYPWMSGYMNRLMNGANGLVDSFIHLPELLVPLGIATNRGEMRYEITCNTAELYTLTIFETQVGSEPGQAQVVPVVKEGPGGTRTGPPAQTQPIPARPVARGPALTPKRTRPNARVP